MTTLLNKNQTSQKFAHKFKTTKELLEHLNFEKAIHQKYFFDYEKEFEILHYRILEIRKQQKHHKEKIFDLEKEIKKYSKPDPAKPKYDYTSFYVFAGLLIATFIVALYFLFTQFIAN